MLHVWDDGDVAQRIVKEFTQSSTVEDQSITFDIPAGYVGDQVGTERGLRFRIGTIGGSNQIVSPDVWESNAGGGVTTANCVNWGENQYGVFYVTDVKLEVGDRATPFVSRPIAEELALCQRYYWQGYSRDAGHGFKYGGADYTILLTNIISLPVPMRVTPTVGTLTAPSTTNCGSLTTYVKPNNNLGFVERATVTANGKYAAVNGIYYADAEL